MTSSPTLQMPRAHRVAGTLIGSAVGDALGAPFEFGPPGQFSARFPADARGEQTEMCGGGPGGQEPGQATDDTQLALVLATSLVEHDGLAEAELLAALRTWAATDTLDIGTQTRGVLDSDRPWDVAAAEFSQATGRSGGNGSLMRTTPAAIFFARRGQAETMDAARRISALTHTNPAAGEACAIVHEMIRIALDGGDPVAALPDVLALVAPEHRGPWETVLAADWTPEDATETNRALWTALGQAVWALRRGRTFAEVMRLVIDLGGDTDTVAAIAGGLAGAVHGIAGIPMRWASVVHGRVPGATDMDWWLADLHKLAARLDGTFETPFHHPLDYGPEPAEVADGVWAADLDGARASSTDFAVISLCRTGTRFPHPLQRFAFLTDDDSNSEIDVVLADVLDDIAALRADGRKVLVHCFAGQSRTGLVMRGWLRRTTGMSVEEATDAVVEKWPYLSTWNDSFTAALERMP